jgi:hypothetical protein
MTLNAHAKEWIEKLPDYAQTRDRLRADDAFCCLGVACDLYAHEGWELLNDSFARGFYAFVEENPAQNFDSREEFELPVRVRDWLGLRTVVGNFRVAGLTHEQYDMIAPYLPTRKMAYELLSLAELNDYGVPFSTMARFIASQPDGLFRDQKEGAV